MALFGKKQPELPANFLDDDTAQAAGVDHNSVLDYLLQLKTEDYDKLLKLTNIYREANKAAGELIPQYDPDRAPEENTELVPHDVNHISPKSKLETEDDVDQLLDDELSAAFLEDEPKSKKVTVKDDQQS